MDKNEGVALYEQARKLAAEGRYAEALPILDTLLQQYPDEPQLLYAKATCLAKLGRVEEAIALCERLERDHNHARAAALKAQLTAIAPSTPQAAPAPKTAPPTRRRRVSPIMAIAGICAVVLVAGLFVVLIRDARTQTPKNQPLPGSATPTAADAAVPPASSFEIPGLGHCVGIEETSETSIPWKSSWVSPQTKPFQAPDETIGAFQASDSEAFRWVHFLSDRGYEHSDAFDYGKCKVLADGQETELLASKNYLTDTPMKNDSSPGLAQWILKTAEGEHTYLLFKWPKSAREVKFVYGDKTYQMKSPAATDASAATGQPSGQAAESPSAAPAVPPAAQQTTSELAGPVWAQIVIGEDIDIKSSMPIVAFQSFQVADDEFVESITETVGMRDPSITMKTIVEKYGAPDTKKAGTSTLGVKDGASYPAVGHFYGPLELITESDESKLKGIGIQGSLLKELAATSDIQALARRYIEAAGGSTHKSSLPESTETTSSALTSAPASTGSRGATVTVARMWKCPKCGTVLAKGNLGKVWNPGDLIETVGGKATCGGCQAQFDQADVYGGMYDVADTAQQTPPSAEVTGPVSVLAFRLDSTTPPEDARAVCDNMLQKKHPRATLDKSYCIGLRGSDPFSVDEVVTQYKANVQEGKMPDLGEQFDALIDKDMTGKEAVILFFRAPGTASQAANEPSPTAPLAAERAAPDGMPVAQENPVGAMENQARRPATAGQGPGLSMKIGNMTREQEIKLTIKLLEKPGLAIWAESSKDSMSPTGIQFTQEEFIAIQEPLTNAENTLLFVDSDGTTWTCFKGIPISDVITKTSLGKALKAMKLGTSATIDLSINSQNAICALFVPSKDAKGIFRYLPVLPADPPMKPEAPPLPVETGGDPGISASVKALNESDEAKRLVPGSSPQFDTSFGYYVGIVESDKKEVKTYYLNILAPGQDPASSTTLKYNTYSASATEALIFIHFYNPKPAVEFCNISECSVIVSGKRSAPLMAAMKIQPNADGTIVDCTSGGRINLRLNAPGSVYLLFKVPTGTKELTVCFKDKMLPLNLGETSPAASGQAADAPASEYPENLWGLCSNDQHGFSFHYPRAWVQVPGSSAMVLRAPDAGSIDVDGKPVFSPCLTCMLSERGNTAGQTPGQVFSDFKQLLPRFFPGFNLKEESTFQLPSGQKANEVCFEFSKGGRPFKSVLAHVVTRNQIYTVDGSCFASDFGTHEKSFRDSLRSLRVTDPQ